jgi:group I intron endonuclease
MGCGIYKIENVTDKKTYIGSSVNIESREYKHFWMLNKGIHDNQHLQNSYNKFGRDSFVFEIIEECEESNLVEKENFFITQYDSMNSKCGYNMAKVNEFRRNTFNDDVKLKLSKYNIKKNGNFSKFILINMDNNKEYIFDNLVDSANYLIENGFAKGKAKFVRMKISQCLRGIKVSNGTKKETIRKSCYKHKFKILN